jgi:prolyl-tRNA synthetase
MFLKKKHLESEKDHLEGFEAEVAWVTRSGKSELAEPIAIRPTSETIMYPVYKKWIQSHRDLPMLYNQWSNVVRWEFKNPTPFIRTREFLWQEGHTAHLTNEDCSDFVLKILDIYADCYKELLAVPVIKGRKSEIEKFAGADFTTTCETFIAEAGRSVQACTSHNLGQNFAKIFDITYEDKDKKTKMPWQASWGFTTRSIGVMIMVHSDNKGLVLPPKVAFKQVVIVPITFNKKTEAVMNKANEIKKLLNEAGIRTHLDDRDNYKPGWKYNDWELKGIPLRLEVGPKDVAKEQYRTVRRVDGNVKSLAMADLVTGVKEILEEAHNVMFQNAEKKLVSNKSKAGDWEIFMDELNQMKYVETPWCCEPDCEKDVKLKSAEESDENSQLSGKAKTLCLPFGQEAVPENTICFNCDNLAKKYAIWGRSY